MEGSVTALSKLGGGAEASVSVVSPGRTLLYI